ncbi:MAG TPA: serine/threonine-protein kinase, partial [Candidatus Eisenbacteria bacterium]|nr:serine/threonine-protein kinase [Candidatus Eisenbacteria bacterium]
MSLERADDLERIAEAVSDGTPVDWKGEMAASPELSSALLGLKRLEKVRVAHEGIPESQGSAPGGSADSERPTRTWHAATTTSVSAAEPPTHAQPLFRWGPLDVLEKVGEGSGGEVFRAYDPSLETEFALKLRKTDDELGSATVVEFLAEGRRLARVRHPNVLVVHGADVHGGRMGIWTDLVRGKSLEAYLKHHGPLSAREASLIGLDLCRALAAVHAAGLVHRDVKTSNVMREEGGRIVLMDFGSMTELPLPGGRRTEAGPQGTPLTMAPEQLRGETAERAADLYALGVLLYRMVSARYPIEAQT